MNQNQMMRIKNKIGFKIQKWIKIIFWTKSKSCPSEVLAKNVEVDQNNWCCEDARRMDPSNKNRYYSYLYVLLKPLISLIYCSGQHKVDFQRNFQSYTIIFCGLVCTPFNYARWLTSLFPRSEFMASDATDSGQEVSLGAQRGLVRTLFYLKLPLFLQLLKNVHTSLILGCCQSGI